MDKMILQVPMSKTLKKQAEEVAYEWGFSSLQESIRVILKQMADRTMYIDIEPKEEYVVLSPAAKRRYRKMDQDFKNNKNVFHAKDINDLMRQLDS